MICTLRDMLRLSLQRCYVVVAMLLLPASSLSAAVVIFHAELKSSVPSAGAHLGVVPRELRLTFTEAPELGFSTVSLVGPRGSAVLLEPIRVASDSKMSIIATVPAALAAGTYTVKWKIAGADGHPVDGQFDFTVAPGAQGSAPNLLVSLPERATSVTAGDSAAMSHGDPTALPMGEGFDSESVGYVLVRWMLFTALLLILGPVAFQLSVVRVLRRKPDATTDRPMFADMSARAAAIGFAAAIAVVGATLLRLFAQSWAMHGAERTFDGALVGSMLASTTWGMGWMLQLAAGLAAIVGFYLARRAQNSGWSIAALAAVVLAFTPGLSGHAAASPRVSSLAMFADGLHVMSAGGWLGTLLVILAVGIPATLHLEADKRSGAVANLINALSPTALAFAGSLAVTGAFAAWLHLGEFGALWQTSYGRTLLVKLALVGLVAATGAYNWRRIKPRLHEGSSARQLQRSGTIEVGVGVLVLLVTAVLVATPPTAF